MAMTILTERNMFSRFVLTIESGDATSDTLINRLCHLLKREAVLNTLDHLRYWGLNTLDTLLHRRDKIADIPLPSWSPLVCLVGKTFLGARHDEVQRCQNANTSRTHAKDLRGLGSRKSGDADGHVDVVVEES
jgi:cell division protein ZapA (FtsZ GTPase activity inhibitor)